MKTVNEIAKITGISRRTIRYYDQIGLLKPSKISESGYRLYDDKALEILQQILIFKELNVPLKDIKLVLDNPNLDKTTLLESHKKLLVLKRNHLTELISLIDKIIKEPKTMTFNNFKINEITRKIEKNVEFLKSSNLKLYEKCIKENGATPEQLSERAIKGIQENPQIIEAMYGSLENYNKSLEMAPQRLENIEKWLDRIQNIVKELCTMKDKDVSCPEVQNLVSEYNTLLIKSSGTDLQGIFKGGEVSRRNLENNTDKLYDYIKERNLAVEKYDKLYGFGSFEFYQKAVKYYIEHKK